ncbi:MAG: ABC transporter ATP-binding protein [Chitinispirillales bacterium]|jgi:iron complex transport system ATP-binding protein|nr:ABC transporter ATP-binding protein [Chitinispirillales bacterium]
MTGLEAKNLFFSYRNKNIVEDITFTVSTGGAWALIGRNGAGKSTLLKCFCGLLRPSRPESVLINGVPISKLSPREIALRVAYVPQGGNRPVPPFTVREYVVMARFPYRNFGTLPCQKDKNRVGDALDIAGISHLAGRMMSTLSGGEFQAALIAGAVCQETPFLLLDEPTTYLDPFHQENVRQIIERVHTERGTAVITVTHDVNFALSTHDNILALVDGKIFFCGTKEEFCIDAAGRLSKIFSVNFRAAECPNQKTVYYTEAD